MKSGLVAALALCCVVLFVGVSEVKAATNNDAYEWAKLEYEILSTPYVPTLLGPNRQPAIGQPRALFLISSCMFDAWAVYDPFATASTIHSGSLKEMPRAVGSLADVNKAVSYAAYSAFMYLFHESSDYTARATALLTSLGYSPDTNTRLDNPAGIGNYMCNLVINERKHDGTNGDGDYPTSNPPNTPYADWIGYVPVNDPQPQPFTTDCAGMRDWTKWTPLRTSATSFQGNYMGSSMIMARPFALKDNRQFLVPGPPLPNTSRAQRFVDTMQELVTLSSQLTDAHKVEIEYWTVVAAVCRFQGFITQTIKNRNLNLATSVKALFVQGAAAWDVSVAAFTYKTFYNSGRPITIIPCLNAGKNITSWGGPYKGTQTFNGSQYKTYSMTVNFPEYPAAHAAYASASAQALYNFFGSDLFYGDPVVLGKGKSIVEPAITDPAAPGYIAGVTDVPNSGPGTPGYSPAADVSILYSTWSDAAEGCSISRVRAGFNIRDSYQDGKLLGRSVGDWVWSVVKPMLGSTEIEFNN